LSSLQKLFKKIKKNIAIKYKTNKLETWTYANSLKMNISNLSLSKALFLSDFFTVFLLVEKFYLKSLFKFDGFSLRSWPWRLCRLDRFTIIVINFMEEFGSISGF